jgi:hypothetical protein
MTVHGTHQRLVAVAGVLALALVASTACTNKKSTGTPPAPAPTSASPTPSVNPSVADAEQQARAAYAGYIDTWVVAAQQADPDNPNLARYIADPLLTLTRHNLRTMKDNGWVQVGAQKATVQSVQVDLAATPPTVTIKSCLDYSNRKLVYKANQKEVPNSGPGTPRVPAVSKVVRYDSGQWLVNEVKQGSEPC